MLLCFGAIPLESGVVPAGGAVRAGTPGFTTLSGLPAANRSMFRTVMSVHSSIGSAQRNT